MGIAADRRIRAAAAQLAAALGDERGELGDIVWTSGGTEADALGTIGAARAAAGQGRHLVCSAVEHPAVRESLGLLEREGWSLTVVPIDGRGGIDVDRFAAAVGADTTVAALMLVQNEIGSVMPVREVARAIKARRPRVHLHVDAVQALGKLPIEVGELGADSVAVSAHKLHGPKGSGALWLRKKARLAPLWAGGGQQAGLRSGTQNVAGIAGLGEAARLAAGALGELPARWRALGERFLAALTAAGLAPIVHGAGAPRAPHILSVGLRGAPAEPLLHALEARGVMVSAGSACASKHKGPSPVLAALGVPDDVGTLRISFGRDTSAAEVDAAARAVIEVLPALRP
jgi:cysteine desulfurase